MQCLRPNMCPSSCAMIWQPLISKFCSRLGSSMPSNAGSYLWNEKAPTPTLYVAQPKQKFQLSDGYKSSLVNPIIAYASLGLYRGSCWSSPCLPCVEYWMQPSPMSSLSRHVILASFRKFLGTVTLFALFAYCPGTTMPSLITPISVPGKNAPAYFM